MHPTYFILILSAVAIIFVVVALVLQAAHSKTSPGQNGTSQSTTPAAPVPSNTSLLPPQAPLPDALPWCTSVIFCPGQVLQTVSIANVTPDQKTFVDKPTNKNSQGVIADFRNISKSTTYGEIATFIENNFVKEGQELKGLFTQPSNYTDSPPFLNNIVSPLAKAFAQIVHTFWPQLIRTTVASALCSDPGKCESTFIPLNHNLLVPGGTFREQYYGDSFWAVEGLLVSQLFSVVNDILQNYMDQLEIYNFIPKGGRTYYLDRSHPPLFIQMLNNYVQASGDTSILGRALPLAEREMQWWNTERSVQVTSLSAATTTYTMYRYSVANSAPRPESYLTDYLTANDPSLKPPLNETQKADVYAELASASESGWEYSTRWFPGLSKSVGLVNLKVRNIIGTDLNSIMYKNHLTLESLYRPTDPAAADRHLNNATLLRAAILDLLWDRTKLAFYDWNLTTKSRSPVFTAAAFYPFWSGIIPDQVANDATELSAFSVFASVNMVLNRYNGSFPATFLESGLQWDAPNAWPPHQYIILQALRNLPQNITGLKLPVPGKSQSTFSLIPLNQLGLSERQLPGQPILTTYKNASATGADADINSGSLQMYISNGGNWSHTLQTALANRYFTNVLCSWYATGGSIPNQLPKLDVTKNDGNMFPKFSIWSIDSVGQKYTTQIGYGWTNGVLLWIAKNYAQELTPQCPENMGVWQ